MALRDCWALQKWNPSVIKQTGQATGWTSFKYFTDIANVAGRVFDMRLKNAEASTLLELSNFAKSIRDEVRKEFGITGCGCK
jgi:hypothetical protein